MNTAHHNKKRGDDGMSKEFFWGTAISAYQVEGGIYNNDWAEAAWKGKVPPAGTACDFWNQYERYLDLAKDLGTNAFRFSIEWARVEPRKGVYDDVALARYSRMIDAMRQRGLEPFVTLWCFTLPQWVAHKGGWANTKTKSYFLRYVKRVAEALGRNVRFWVVVNEPSIVLGMGYLLGVWPPGYNSAIYRYFTSRNNLKKAVIEAYAILREVNPSALIGSAFNINVIEPARLWNPLDRLVARLKREFDDREFISSVKNSLDFIGLNYYMKFRIQARLFPYPRIETPALKGKPASDLGWEIFPEGLKIILLELSHRFGKPIIVTENGIADALDSRRPEFIRTHIEAMLAAKRLGADVRGYLHWSLMDNFEWAHGYGPRFGIYEIHRSFGLIKPVARKSAAVYTELIAEYSSRA
jgi:beta-glucosidase